MECCRTALCIKLFGTRNIQQHQRVPLRIFLVVRQNFWSLIVIAPSLCIKFFDARNFHKHQRVPLQSFSVLWYEKFSSKVVMPHLRIKFFDNASFPKHHKGHPHDFFFCDARSFHIFFVIPSSVVYRNFSAGRWAAPALSCSQLVFSIQHRIKLGI